MNAAAFAHTLFTADQHHVLAAIAQGASVTAAARSGEREADGIDSVDG